MKEFETRILNINKEAIISKLETIGAEIKQEEVLQKRYIFENQDLIAKNAWIRLRLVDGKAELTYKQRETGGDIEHSTNIDNVEATIELLQSIGLNLSGYQENKRLKYVLKNITFDIDTWPMIDPYIEIEAESQTEVERGVALLGYGMDDCTDLVGDKLYNHFGIDLKQIKELKF